MNGILSARISKFMTTDRPIQSGEVTILTLSEYHTRTDDTRSKHNLLDIPLLSKRHYIFSTTDIRLEILMILMSRSTVE